MTYNEFIQSIKESRENKYFPYSERHHIIPRCLGGTDDEENLIYLTMKEHYIAHQLLVKENPENRKLAYALWRMSRGKLEISAEEYEQARSLYVESMSIELKGRKFSEESLMKMSLAHKGVRLSDETRKNISKSLLGNSRAKGNQSFLGKTHTEETKEKLRNYNIGKEVPEDIRKKISNATKGVPKSEEFRKFMSESQKGELHNNYGKVWVHNDSIRKLISPNEVEYYISLGYERGRGSNLGREVKSNEQAI